MILNKKDDEKTKEHREKTREGKRTGFFSPGIQNSHAEHFVGRREDKLCKMMK